MSICKDCIHYEPCYEYGNILDTIHGGVICDSFKSKADVVEVRHGYWKRVTELKNDTVCGNGVNIQYKICSNCKYPMGVMDNIYCGHCGAKMDGERSEEENKSEQLY